MTENCKSVYHQLPLITANRLIFVAKLYLNKKPNAGVLLPPPRAVEDGKMACAGEV